MKKLDFFQMCGILNLLCIHIKLRNFIGGRKMVKVFLAIVLSIVLFSGCTFSLKGLDIVDGEKNLNLESLETTE